ncbi:unnamed protein product [Polarella glacialis]|uniref:EamA domain-containing protein n=1 Tax=Polarella glacialis TaxID=89957 RepID=A0A813KD80_POLGL|nr:unnamed protein product [Polarella glacialis]
MFSCSQKVDGRQARSRSRRWTGLFLLLCCFQLSGAWTRFRSAGVCGNDAACPRARARGETFCSGSVLPSPSLRRAAAASLDFDVAVCALRDRQQKGERRERFLLKGVALLPSFRSVKRPRSLFLRRGVTSTDVVPGKRCSVAVSSDAASGEVPSPKDSGISSGLVVLNIVTMLFGCNQALIKTLETGGDNGSSGVGMDSSLCMVLRFGIAALALLAALVALRVKAAATVKVPGTSDKIPLQSGISLGDRTFLAGALELSVWLYLGFLAQAKGLEYTSAQAGALLGSFTVVLVPLLSALDGRPVPKSTWPCVGLALVGSALFVGPEALTSSSAGGLGDLLELASAGLFAVQLWRCEKICRSVPEDRLLELTCLQLALVAGMSLVFLLGVEGASMPHLMETMASWPAVEWVQVASMGLVTTAFCLLAEAWALREVDAAPAAIIYALEPVWGAIFAFFWMGETLQGPAAFAGGSLLLLASAIGVLAPSMSEKTPGPET